MLETFGLKETLEELPGDRASRRMAARLALWLVPLAVGSWVVWHVAATPPPSPSPTPDARGPRFGVSESKQREIFGEIAGEARGWRKRAKRKFRGSKWSREDHYHNLLRKKVEELAESNDLPYTTIYLIYDRGIRQRWKGPDGEPLPATTVPLDARNH